MPAARSSRGRSPRQQQPEYPLRLRKLGLRLQGSDHRSRRQSAGGAAPGRSLPVGAGWTPAPAHVRPRSNRKEVGERKHRHQQRRGGDNSPKNLHHALSAHLLLPGSPWLWIGLVFAEGALAALIRLTREGLVDGLPETFLVAFIIVVLGVPYRTVLDHEQPGHPFDVVLGDQFSRRVQEHRVGNVVDPRSAVDVDDSEGGLIVLVLPGKILEAGNGLVRVLVEGTPEGEYVDTVVRELEDAVVYALHPESGGIVAHVRGWLG